MYEKGQILVHQSHGLCEILDHVIINEKPFYKISTLGDSRMSLFVNDSNMDSAFFKTITANEADEIILKIKRTALDVNVLSKAQRLEFIVCLPSASLEKCASIYGTMLNVNKFCIENKKKIGFQDQQILEKSQKKIYDVLSVAYNVSREIIADFVNQKLENVKE